MKKIKRISFIIFLYLIFLNYKISLVTMAESILTLFLVEFLLKIIVVPALHLDLEWNKKAAAQIAISERKFEVNNHYYDY